MRRPLTNGGPVLTDLEIRKAFLEITETDIRLLTNSRANLAAARERFVDKFYARLMRFDETRKLIVDVQTVERLKRMQAAYLDRLFAGDYGTEYGDDRLRVGVAHHRIGLEPKWYISSSLGYGLRHKWTRCPGVA